MALEVKISLEGNPSAALEAARRPILEGSARAMTNTLVRHFRERNRSRERKEGWPRSNYWAKAAESVTSEAGADRAVATVRKEGVRLHWLGGIVRPREGRRAVAIPNVPEVAGIWPSEYRGKQKSKPTFMVWKAGAQSGFIAAREKGQKGFRVLWWLREETEHDPDPTVIPSAETFAKAVEKACKAVLKAMKNKTGGVA